MMKNSIVTMKFVLCLWTALGARVAAEYQTGIPHKAVVNLDPSTFTKAIKDPANPNWFLKFYAPWCGHCKKMAPVLDQVAPQLEGKLAIGKIDCTVHKPLCSEYKIRGFPTLMYSIDGEVKDYPGGRDADSIIAFANRISGPSIHVVQSYEEAMAFVKELPEGLAFLGYDPNASESAESETQLQQIYNQVARLNRASSHFVWLTRDERNYPFIHKIESNLRPRSYQDDDTDIASITTESLGAWVQAHNVPLVVEFGSNNFGKISKSGRPLAVSVVDFANEAQKKAVKDHMLSYAASLSPKEADKYYYGIMDGGKWAKFLAQFNVLPEDNPQLIILDMPAKTFIQNSTYKNVIDFMKAVESGEIELQKVSKPKKEGVLDQIERLFVDNFPYSILVVLAIVFGLVLVLVPRPEKPAFEIVAEQGELIPDDDDDDAPQNQGEQESKKDK